MILTGVNGLFFGDQGGFLGGPILLFLIPSAIIAFAGGPFPPVRGSAHGVGEDGGGKEVAAALRADSCHALGQIPLIYGWVRLRSLL